MLEGRDASEKWKNCQRLMEWHTIRVFSKIEG